MKNTQIQKKSLFTAENVATAAFVAAAFLAPTVGLAAGGDPDFTKEGGGACTFIRNIHTVLNLMSVAVVTIAIIFAGYQIAFAHKRISDVAPILIGGVLIGAAGQIAKMLVGNADSCSATKTAIMMQVMQFFA
ncbi:TrbC/VirB2 family protein [Neisseria sp. P0019.S003]|uniref:TrbC/VirB2 family protein n=1 Tax=Neisseria sp. P0019.S003 TaxID=3436799 RepID=UPI003F8211D2